jgi:hypothetical protein
MAEHDWIDEQPVLVDEAQCDQLVDQGDAAGRYYALALLLLERSNLVGDRVTNGSIADSARITALYATAFLACAVLGDHGCPVPAAAELCARFAPDPSGGSAWAPST